MPAQDLKPLPVYDLKQVKEMLTTKLKATYFFPAPLAVEKTFKIVLTTAKGTNVARVGPGPGPPGPGPGPWAGPGPRAPGPRARKQYNKQYNGVSKK